MSQIRFLSEEQEALISEYQTKWQNVSLSTEPINRERASAAVKEVYAVMGKPEPEIVFCTSPYNALERLETYISQVEIPQVNNIQSPEEMLQGLNFAKFFVKAIGETVKQNNKRQKTETKVIFDLIKELSQQPNKSLAKHIENTLPEDLTTQQIVEQSFLGASPLFNYMGKQQARKGEPDLLKTLQTKSSEEWHESFSQTASGVEQQLSWLPGKKFLFEQWLKNFLRGTVSSKITGIENLNFKSLFLAELSLARRKFLAENPPVITPELAISCIYLDFCFSVMNYPCKSDKWRALQNLVRNCGWIFGMSNTCLICNRPTKILINEARQLHGEGEPAIEYSDGYVAYAYNSYPVPEKYGSVRPNQWQAEWVLAETNKNLKEVLIQGIGAVRLCQELSLIEVEKNGEYTLFQLDENTGTRATYILQRINTETNEIKAVLVSWTSNTLTQAIQYAHEYYSAEDFPLID